MLEALTAVYEETMAGEAGADVGERPSRRYEFQDALLGAIAKIRTRLGTTGAEEDTSSASAATNALGKECNYVSIEHNNGVRAGTEEGRAR